MSRQSLRNLIQQGASAQAPLVGMRWSDAATWGSDGPPAQNEHRDIEVPAGQTLILDAPVMYAGKIRYAGNIIVDKSKPNLQLFVDDMADTDPGASFIVSTADSPYPEVNRFTATFTGTKANASRYFHFMGTFEAHGFGQGLRECKINAHAAAGTQVITMAPRADGTYMKVKVGQEFVITSTTFYGNSSPERFTATADSAGPYLYLPTPLVSARYGKVQWVQDVAGGQQAFTETPNPTLTLSSSTYTGPISVDGRATVMLLSSNVVFEGANDNDSNVNSYGLETMGHMGGTRRNRNVEFRRVGHAGTVGAYPIHWHMQSYNMPNGMNSPSDGSFIGDLVNNYTEDCAVHESYQRAITVHGTCGVSVQRNVGYNIFGFAVFEEDGSEERNLIKGNVMCGVRVRNDNDPLQIRKFDRDAGGFWFANPNNKHINNRAYNCEGRGIMNAFNWTSNGYGCVGLSSAVHINPGQIEFVDGDWVGNESHGSGMENMSTREVAVDTAGNLVSLFFGGQPGGSEVGTGPLAVLRDFRGSKAGFDNYVNQASKLHYDGWAIWDCPGHGLIGSANGVVQNMLLAGPSLNYESPTNNRPDIYYGAASYHWSVAFSNIMGVNHAETFPLVPLHVSRNDLVDSSGLFDWSDMYLSPLVVLFNSTSGLMFKNSHVGLRQPSRWQEQVMPVYGGRSATGQGWQVSGAAQDLQGNVGPATWHWVYDDPFFTHGISTGNKIAVGTKSLNGVSANGVSVNRKFYGAKIQKNDFGNNQEVGFKRAVTITRLTDTSSLSSPVTAGVYQCTSSPFALSGLNFSGVGNGSLGTITIAQNKAYNEDWTITATSATNFTVVGSFSGAMANAAVGTTYSNGIISFTISAGATAFAVGDKFRFSLSDIISQNFSHLGGFVMAKGGRYIIDFPQDGPSSREIIMRLTCAAFGDQNLIYSLPWSGTASPIVFEGWRVGYSTFYESPNGTNVRGYTSCSSEAQFLASTGDTYWVDTGNQRIWMMHKGGYASLPNVPTIPDLTEGYLQQTLAIDIRDPSITVLQS